MADQAAAVIYPELHTRMVSWWLCHAWRGLDLLEDTIENLWRWRIASGAVTGRALIEEAASLNDEARKLGEAWKTGKITPAGELSRPQAVRDTLAPILLHASFGSRTKESLATLQATNVLTLVKKLGKQTAGGENVLHWYDWLSDAAHPAFGSRIAYSSPPIGHQSRAVMMRVYARSPLSLVGKGSTQDLEPTIALAVADSLILSGKVITGLLEQSLALVDDFGLTTSAATLTRRSYWRNFVPTRGGRQCPCGRGRWSDCRHRWGGLAPVVATPN
ncbi:hypothetical protein SAMN05421678_106259 [Actinopolymorpha cephalotaxi]|uniref:Uncharacterized protein n=1 Tax=Actinopolymorpha cephalotaxi TaxID=504797 RepID=A0A1I2SKP9_9ACTN|nr:hypothetical protein [Actinopolymorpha cephalotaxi]SFG53242.1 hypothetical protein SAMN05421678_106259 [Actinopolymorpha cephalotaxi]